LLLFTTASNELGVKEWNFMLINAYDYIRDTLPCTGRLRALRARLTALAALCLSLAFTPQAFAQCGPAIDLAAEQWRLVGLPCNAVAGAGTVQGVFGPSLGTANYNVTWVVWTRVYGDATTCPGAAPNDCYQKATLTTPILRGEGYWLYTTQAATLQYPTNFNATTSNSFNTNAYLSPTAGTSRYGLYSNPYATTKNWTNIIFPVTINGNAFQATLQQAIDNNIVTKNVYYWNGVNTYFTRDNTSSPNPAATFVPKEAAWLEFLRPADTVTNVIVRTPGP
jgi:hypothetical protein